MSKLAKAKSDAKRLIDQGGVELHFSKGIKKISDQKQLVEFEEKNL